MTTRSDRHEEERKHEEARQRAAAEVTSDPPAHARTSALAPAPTHTEAEAAELEALYAQLKPEAIEEARKYVLARTPAKFQQDMIDLIEVDFPPPEPPPEADATRRRAA